jgi:hypothetical protein
MSSLSPLFLWLSVVAVSNVLNVVVVVTTVIVTVIINWLLCWALCPGAALASELDSIRSAPESHRMTLRLWLYQSNAGRWRRRTRQVNVLKRPLAFREKLLGWSRRAIFALAALLALAVTLLALLTPVFMDALRGAALEPDTQPSYCDKDPFTLGEDLFVCASAGTPLPPWSRPEEPVEFATQLDYILISIWSGAWSLVESCSLELGSLLSNPAWSTLEALEQPGDPREAWMQPPRFVPFQKSPTHLTPSLTTRRGNDPFNYNLVSAVKAALTRGPHWRSTCAGLAADSGVTQVVCSGFYTWQNAVAYLQSAGPAAQLLPLLIILCIFAFTFYILDELVGGRAEVSARAEPEPAQMRPRGRTRSTTPNVQPGRHTPGKMNRRKRMSRRQAETQDETPSSSPGEKTDGVDTEATQTTDANADAAHVSPQGHVSQPSEVHDQAVQATGTAEEPADVTQADEGTAQGVASPAGARRGFVATTCNFVVRASGIPARLLSFVFFLLLNVLRFFCLALLRIVLVPFKFIHFTVCTIWHFAVITPLYTIPHVYSMDNGRPMKRTRGFTHCGFSICCWGGRGKVSLPLKRTLDQDCNKIVAFTLFEYFCLLILQAPDVAEVLMRATARALS